MVKKIMANLKEFDGQDTLKYLLFMVLIAFTAVISLLKEVIAGSFSVVIVLQTIALILSNFVGIQLYKNIKNKLD